jgi:hypothetical protein
VCRTGEVAQALTSESLESGGLDHIM